MVKVHYRMIEVEGEKGMKKIGVEGYGRDKMESNYMQR